MSGVEVSGGGWGWLRLSECEWEYVEVGALLDNVRFYERF